MTELRPQPGRKKLIGSDRGFTYAEAIVSVVLLTLVFLGFTVTLLAFREWINRAWAIRVMDQYANDVVSNLERHLRKGSEIWRNNPQNGLGSFRIIEHNFVGYPFSENTITYNFSAHPLQGVKMAIGNTAPQKIDEDFPVTNWKDEHEFTMTKFEYVDDGSLDDPKRSVSFNEAMAHILLTIQYERLREVETPTGIKERQWNLQKEYRVAYFMKNHMQ